MYVEIMGGERVWRRERLSANFRVNKVAPKAIETFHPCPRWKRREIHYRVDRPLVLKCNLQI